VNGGASIVGSNSGTSVIIRFTSATSTSVTLSVTANNSCGASTPATLAITVNLACRTVAISESPAGFEELIAYPNPTSSRLNISFLSGQEDEAVIRVFDMLGKLHQVKSLQVRQGENLETLELEGLQRGVYFVYVERAGEVVGTIRVVLQ
jgi:hypothetical protein